MSTATSAGVRMALRRFTRQLRDQDDSGTLRRLHGFAEREDGAGLVDVAVEVLLARADDGAGDREARAEVIGHAELVVVEVRDADAGDAAFAVVDRGVAQGTRIVRVADMRVDRPLVDREVGRCLEVAGVAARGARRRAGNFLGLADAEVVLRDGVRVLDGQPLPRQRAVAVSYTHL